MASTETMPEQPQPSTPPREPPAEPPPATEVTHDASASELARPAPDFDEVSSDDELGSDENAMNERGATYSDEEH
jgi:hypothetical protein